LRFDELNDNEKGSDMTMENDVLENKEEKNKTICPRSQYSMSMIQMHAGRRKRRESVSRKNQGRPPRQGDGEDGTFIRFDAQGTNHGYSPRGKRVSAQALR
jgi:hypothetical protein